MWLSLLLIVLALLFLYLKKTYSYWSDRGVPGPNPVYILGNFGAALTGRKSLHDIYGEIYREYEDYPFVGLYRMFTPVLLIRDPELIQNVMVKDFKNFQSNDVTIDKNTDRLFGRNPFVLKGLEWKTKRTQLRSLLTSGKVKAMYPILEEVSKRMVKYIQDHCINGYVALDSKEVSIRFTLDNIAACAMGLEGNCFSEEYSVFRKLGDDFLSPGTSNSLKASILFWFPVIGSLFRFKFITTDAEDQLIGMVREAMEERRRKNVSRNDFLDSILQLCKSSTYNEEIDIIAQVAAFFLDAYETGSWAMSFVLLKLAGHPDCQLILREEIDNYCKKSDGRLDYDTIHDMPYLQACINESLRMIPLIRQLFKVCTEGYTYTCMNSGFKNLSINIEPETRIVLPAESLQRDEKYFSDPEKFMPERFLGRAEHNKFCFLPFGEGHRSCIGKKFGLTQLKIGVAQIIRHFELTVNNRTLDPLQYDKWYFVTCPIGGLWLNFKVIEKK